MIIFKLFMVLVLGNGQYSLLNIGDHYFATEVECNEVGRKVAETYTAGKVVWFCEPREVRPPESPQEARE